MQGVYPDMTDSTDMRYALPAPRTLIASLLFFYIQRYCRAFPDDPVCPKPDCGTYESIGATPEYCDRNTCLKFMPGTGFQANTLLDTAQKTVCMLSCSAQQLGPIDNVDTMAMRNHCR